MNASDKRRRGAKKKTAVARPRSPRSKAERSKGGRAGLDLSVVFGPPAPPDPGDRLAWMYGTQSDDDELHGIPPERLAAITASLVFVGQFRELLKYGPFARDLEAANDGGPRSTDLDLLEAIASFVGHLAAGAATRADWGRLRRMYAALRTRDETKQARLVELVRSSATWTPGDHVSGNLRRRLMTEVDPCFSKLRDEEIAVVLANQKMGDFAKAAEFAIRSGMPGVGAYACHTPVERRKRVATQLRNAEASLRKA